MTGFCGQFSLGHAGFYGIGAYTAALLAVTWGSPFVLNLLAAAVAPGVAGFLIGLPTLRLGGIYLAMATLGFGEIIHLVLLNWLAVTRGPLGIPAIPGPALFGLDLATPARQYYVALALVVLATVVVSRLVDSSFGEAIQAIREDEVAAEALGIPTTRLKVITFTPLGGARRGGRRLLRPLRDVREPGLVHARRVDPRPLAPGLRRHGQRRGLDRRRGRS